MSCSVVRTSSSEATSDFAHPSSSAQAPAYLSVLAPTSGTDKREIRFEPATRQIRSPVLSVDLVGSRPIWPAHVGRVVDLVGSRRIPSDRLDDQADDQASHAVPGRADESGTRFSVWSSPPFSSFSDPLSMGQRLRIHRRLDGCTSWVPADRQWRQPYPTRRIAEPCVVMDEELVSGNRTLSSSPM